MNDKDFYAKYQSINFDTILSDPDLLQSKDLYINYKNEYYNKTQANYNNLKNLNNQLDELLSKEKTKNDTKYTFLYIDQNKIELLKKEIKDVLFYQNLLFDNFNHYLLILNADKHNFNTKQNSKKFLNLFKKKL